MNITPTTKEDLLNNRERIKEKRDSLMNNHPLLIQKVQQNKILITQYINQLKSLKVQKMSEEQQIQQLEPLAKEALSKMYDISEEELLNNASIENALQDAESQHILLKQQLNKISKELTRLELELEEKTKTREKERAKYIQQRMEKEKEAIQQSNMSAIINDVEQYDHLLQLEEKATLNLLETISDVQESILDRKKKFDMEESIVIADQRNLLEAWSIQESALIESLEEIEQDTLLLGQQSLALRDRSRRSVIGKNGDDDDDDDDDLSDITRSEIEAELFHCMELMRTKHSQLGVLKRRLAIMHEERSSLNVMVSKWREENHLRTKYMTNIEKNMKEYHQKNVNNIDSIRSIMKRKNDGGRSHEDEKRSDLPEIELLKQLDHMTRATEWKSIDSSRDKKLHTIATSSPRTDGGGAGGGGEEEDEEEEEEEEEEHKDVTESPTTSAAAAKANNYERNAEAEAMIEAHRMWLGKQWLLKDNTEKELDNQYYNYVRRIKFHVDDLLNIQMKVTKKLKVSETKYMQLKNMYENEKMKKKILLLKKQCLVHSNNNTINEKEKEKDETDAKNVHLKLDRCKKKLFTINRNIMKYITILEKEQKTYEANIKVLNNIDSLKLQYKNNIDYTNDQLDKLVEPLPSQVLMTPSPALPTAPLRQMIENQTQEKKKKRKKNKNINDYRETTSTTIAAEKLYFLTQGGRVVEQPSGEKRLLRVSKDFERLELLTVSTGKRKVFYLIEKMSSIHQNRKKKIFSILFQSSNKVMFQCSNLNELDQWIHSLEFLL
jgi:hypothetical protein